MNKEAYLKIKEMRKKYIAPVDVMGCYSIPEVVRGDEQKLYVLISLLLSSQTKDEINYQSMLNLINSTHGNIVVNNSIKYKNVFTEDGNYLEVLFNGINLKIIEKNLKEKNDVEQKNDVAIVTGLKEVPFGLKSIREMTIEEINKCIAKVGFHNKKAETIKSMCEFIVQNGYPKTLKECLRIKGMGLKMSLLYLNKFYGVHGISVDTHVHRICNRIGLVRTTTPEKTSKALEVVFDEEEYKSINSVFVGFGQIICTAIKPKCGLCVIKKECRFFNNW
ncbi:Endonuclease III like protein [Nosema granulosis]|uniref:Endonuclease III like protein n=1 Tax=Nosema granulosis TaxID=83296 RepID=A0A9P6L0C8_9MICR|nr:Endonuclease III like protein [Nosema granulosis]